MLELVPGGHGQAPGPAVIAEVPQDAVAPADPGRSPPIADPPEAVQQETQAPKNPVARVLDDFLSTLVKLDSDAFFWEPVQEKDAPRYFDVVKHPMDIQTMREKVHAGTYLSWLAFVADFELMCSNAMVYNQKRSRVHKTAVTMLRQGKKQLQVIEADGQKAILALNPNATALSAPLGTGPATAATSACAPAAAAAAGAGVQLSTGLLKPPPKPPLKPPQKAGLRSPPKPQMPKKAAPPKKSRLAGHLLSGGRGSSFAEAAAAAAAAIPETAWSDGEECQMEHEEGPCFSSYSGTDMEGEGAVASTAEGPAAAASPVDAACAAQSGSDSKSQVWDAAPSEATSLWRVRRRSAEWRAHWLELRLLDLARQADVYQSQLAALHAAPQQAAPAAGTPHPGVRAAEQPDAAHQGFLAAEQSATALPGQPGGQVAGAGVQAAVKAEAGAAAQEAAPLLMEAARPAQREPAASAAAAAPPAPVCGPLESLQLQQPPVLRDREIEDARVTLVQTDHGAAGPMEGVELQVSRDSPRAKPPEPTHISVLASSVPTSTPPVPLSDPTPPFPPQGSELPPSLPHTSLHQPSVPDPPPLPALHLPSMQPFPQQAAQALTEPHAPPWEIPPHPSADPRVQGLRLTGPSATVQPQGLTGAAQSASAQHEPPQQQQMQLGHGAGVQSGVQSSAGNPPGPAEGGQSSMADHLSMQQLPPQQQQQHHRRPRSEVPEFCPAMLLRHSFMAAHAGLKRNPQVVLEQEPVSVAAASSQLPVAIHASLELLDRQVDILARKLLQVPHSDHARGKGPRGQGRAGRGRGRGLAPQKRARTLGTVSSMDRHLARRKVDEEGMYGTSTPRHDRLPVPDIKTPAVRALSDVELLQRNSSIAFFRTSSGMDGLSRGPSRGPSSVAALVAEMGAQTPALPLQRVAEDPPPPLEHPLGGPPRLPSGLPLGDLLASPREHEGDEEGAGSSSEDTSDAFYQALHREFETQEQIKHGLQPGGGAQKKPPSHGQLKQSLEAKAQRQQQLPHAFSAPPAVIPPPATVPLGAVPPAASGTAPVTAGSAPPQSLSELPAPLQLPLAPIANGAHQDPNPHHMMVGSPPRPRGRPPGSHRGRGRGPGRPSGRGRAASGSLKADGSGRGRSGRGRGRAAEPAIA